MIGQLKTLGSDNQSNTKNFRLVLNLFQNVFNLTEKRNHTAPIEQYGK
jgi:hypothetical protein